MLLIASSSCALGPSMQVPNPVVHQSEATFDSSQTFLRHAHRLPHLDHLIPGAIHEVCQVVHRLQIRGARIDTESLRGRTWRVLNRPPFHADHGLTLVRFPLLPRVTHGYRRSALLNYRLALYQLQLPHWLQISCRHRRSLLALALLPGCVSWRLELSL